MRRRALLAGVLSAIAASLAAAPAPAQQLTEYPLADGARPTGIAAGPDGALWFTQTGAGRIGRITTAGRLHEFALPGPRSDPVNIAAGRDALFYTVHGGGRVGRIELGGAVREVSVQTCPAPTCGLRWPNGIAVAEDGSPWFMVQRNFALVNLGEDAAYADLCSLDAQLENERCAPVDSAFEPSGHTTGGPTLGPDGAMWFTNKYERFIGRVATTGPRTVKRFDLPRRNDPEAITLGPDGALWWVEGETDEIGRITTTGLRTAFRVRRGSRPRGITAGPDGAVWFTMGGSAGNAIARIGSDGEIREFPLPAPNSRPASIVTGADGALWFTESGGNRIGRLVPPPTTATATDAPAPSTTTASASAGGARADAGDGSGAGAPAPGRAGAERSARPSDPTPASQRAAALRPRGVSARRAGRFVAVRFRLPVRASVRVTVARITRRGRRTAATVRRSARPGVNRVRLRVGRLRRGRYEAAVALAGRDAGAAPATARVRVRVRR